VHYDLGATPRGQARKSLSTIFRKSSAGNSTTGGCADAGDRSRQNSFAESSAVMETPERELSRRRPPVYGERGILFSGESHAAGQIPGCCHWGRERCARVGPLCRGGPVFGRFGGAFCARDCG